MIFSFLPLKRIQRGGKQLQDGWSPGKVLGNFLQDDVVMRGGKGSPVVTEMRQINPRLDHARGTKMDTKKI
jgi:hypothetical protein